ncbi:MAG TPA: YoaK family protein [Acidimicrobiales bacterium]|nr:YoaK family protein [Acidimicrobiales bacterium]
MHPPQPLVASLAALTLVSGFLDAVSYLGLGHVFTANMTGNVVLLGFAVAGAAGFSMTASLTALGGFLLGAVIAGRIARHVRPNRSMMMVVMTMEVGLTVVAAVIAASVAVLGSGWPRYTVITLLALSMGARNAVVRRLGVPDMTTTVLTTTLTGLASESFLAGGTNPNAHLRITSVVSMFVGAIVGAALTIHVHPALALGLAAVIVASTTAFFARETPARLGLA